MNYRCFVCPGSEASEIQAKTRFTSGEPRARAATRMEESNTPTGCAGRRRAAATAGPEVTGGTVLVRVKAAGLNAINNGSARDRALPATPAPTATTWPASSDGNPLR